MRGSGNHLEKMPACWGDVGERETPQTRIHVQKMGVRDPRGCRRGLGHLECCSSSVWEGKSRQAWSEATQT